MAHSLRLARASTNAAADAVTARLDGGALRIYAGPRPATADGAVGGSAVLLAECDFQDPAFDAARDGVAEALPLGIPRAVGSGAPAWFRAIAGDGGPVFDGSVGVEGSRADLVLSVATIQIGAELVITTMTYRHPASESELSA